MKKSLLIVISITFATFISAQSQKRVPISMEVSNQFEFIEQVPQINQSNITYEKPEQRTEIIDGRAISYVPIGISENIFSFANNSRTYLWADPVLNSVVFTHRVTGGDYDNSRVAFDVSTDGGLTFTNDIEAYDPRGPGYIFTAARFPQGGIINPTGNDDPDNAYYTYFCPTLDGSNGQWGGFAYGSGILTDTIPVAATENNVQSGDDYWRFIPNAFTITHQGLAWYVDGSFKYNDTTNYDYDYTGKLILGKGEIIDGEIEYEESLLDFLAPNDIANDVKIAFAPDGLTGYICILSNSQSDPIPYSNYHPILLKTTDGGNTWSDPIHVQLGGVDGIEQLKYYWSDEIIASIDYYGSGFNRDEVYYNLGYNCDLIVDGAGNPHITGIIALATDEGWFPSEGTMATWHVYSNDGGSNWDATALYDNIFFEGEIDVAQMYNRPYASSTFDGDLLFFSWIDTDLEGAEGNTNPNIFIVGYDTEDMVYTDVDNVTELSLYWFSAFYGSMSQYVFSSDYKYAECEIPFVFAEFTVTGDPYSQIQYWYIDGYTYLCEPWGIDEDESSLLTFSISQNSPNPAFDITSILVTTKTRGEIILEIHNTLGQLVHHESVNNNALAHTFYVDVCNFDPGLYVYTIRIGNNSGSNKMLVK